MIVIRQKEFNSKAQKERRAKWETQSQSRPSQRDIDRQMKDPRSALEKKLDSELGIKDNPRYNKTEGQAIEAAKKNNFRFDRRFENKVADKLETDPALRQKFRKEAADRRKGQKQILKDIVDLGKKWAVEDAEREAKWKAERKAAKSKASIAKHEAKAAELRAKKVAGQKMVKNLKTAGKVGIGVAGAAGIGYGIKKAVDKNKKENGKEK